MAYNPIRCYLCNVQTCKTANCVEKQPIFKQINGEVRQSSSQRLTRLGASHVGRYYCDKCAPLEWNQSSDRPYASGSGIRMGMKLGRPGSGVSEPVGGGVDVKHGSYQRRLRKLHSKTII
jgi:hypothetical protein|tara:strand:- start:203 stop:562 length:360 start_codon:yes stop_codon:yes gene_type:complete